MALIKAKGQQTSAVQRLNEGSDVYIRALRDGTLINVPWVTALAMEGKIFGVNAGVLTTPLTFNATIADGEPDLLINVPSGITILPLMIQVGFEDTGTVQVLDVFAVTSPVYDNANTSTALTIRNLRTDLPAQSSCSAMAVVTADGTALETGNYFEFWRPLAGFGDDAFNGNTSWVNSNVAGCRWTIGENLVPPIVVGQGSLGVYASAQAGTGFITAIWAEFPSGTII